MTVVDISKRVSKSVQQICWQEDLYKDGYRELVKTICEQALRMRRRGSAYVYEFLKMAEKKNPCAVFQALEYYPEKLGLDAGATESLYREIDYDFMQISGAQTFEATQRQKLVYFVHRNDEEAVRMELHQIRWNFNLQLVNFFYQTIRSLLYSCNGDIAVARFVIMLYRNMDQLRFSALAFHLSDIVFLTSVPIQKPDSPEFRMLFEFALSEPYETPYLLFHVDRLFSGLTLSMLHLSEKQLFHRLFCITSQKLFYEFFLLTVKLLVRKYQGISENADYLNELVVFGNATQNNNWKKNNAWYHAYICAVQILLDTDNAERYLVDFRGQKCYARSHKKTNTLMVTSVFTALLEKKKTCITEYLKYIEPFRSIKCDRYHVFCVTSKTALKIDEVVAVRHANFVRKLRNIGYSNQDIIYIYLNTNLCLNIPLEDFVEKLYENLPPKKCNAATIRKEFKQYRLVLDPKLTSFMYVACRSVPDVTILQKCLDENAQNGLYSGIITGYDFAKKHLEVNAIPIRRFYGILSDCHSDKKEKLSDALLEELTRIPEPVPSKSAKPVEVPKNKRINISLKFNPDRYVKPYYNDERRRFSLKEIGTVEVYRPHEESIVLNAFRKFFSAKKDKCIESFPETEKSFLLNNNTCRFFQKASGKKTINPLPLFSKKLFCDGIKKSELFLLMQLFPKDAALFYFNSGGKLVLPIENFYSAYGEVNDSDIKDAIAEYPLAIENGRPVNFVSRQIWDDYSDGFYYVESFSKDGIMTISSVSNTDCPELF